MADSKAQDLTVLKQKIQSLKVVVQGFGDTVLNNTRKAHEITERAVPPNDPLDILRDASALLKAQTTKLSLLLITEPFSPKAIIPILDDCNGECLALFTAWEIIQLQREQRQGVWPNVLVNQVRMSLYAAFQRFSELVALLWAKCERQSHVVERPQLGVDADERKRVLQITGPLWSACERLGQIAGDGVLGFLKKRVGELKNLIQDAIDELRRWSEDVDEEGDEGSEATSVDEDDLDDEVQANNKFPKGREDVEERFVEAMRRLRLVVQLYQGLLKRRFTPALMDAAKTNEDRNQIMLKLDRLTESGEYLQIVQDAVDELAAVFYNLDMEKVDVVQSEILAHALAAAEKAKLSWDGKEDQFTVWINNWEAVMKQKRTDFMVAD